MPKQQSQLEKQRSRAETLTRFAIKQHNRRARDLKSQRVKTEKKAEEMVARQEERYRNYLKAQQINANSGGGMAGAMQGGMTGASLGGMVGGPWGALAGGLIGAAGGGLYGASEGRQAVAQLALTEALEAHEQQGKRFVDTYGGSKVRTGFPKSTRSMGKTVEPLRGPTGPDGSEAVPFDKYNQNSKKTADQTLMENMRKK